MQAKQGPNLEQLDRSFATATVGKRRLLTIEALGVAQALNTDLQSTLTVMEPSAEPSTSTAVEGIEKPPKVASGKPRKRFVGTSSKASSSRTPIRRIANQIPDDILHDPVLNEAISRELYLGLSAMKLDLMLRQTCRATTTLRSTRRFIIFGEMGSRLSLCRCRKG